MILGTVNLVDSTKGLSLIIDGEDSPTEKKYTYLASYVPAKNDRVLIEEISGSYIIIGKLITSFSGSGIVQKSSNADNSINARYVRNNGVSNGSPITFNASSTGLQVVGNGFNFKLKP